MNTSTMRRIFIRVFSRSYNVELLQVYCFTSWVKTLMWCSIVFRFLPDWISQKLSFAGIRQITLSNTIKKRAENKFFSFFKEIMISSSRQTGRQKWKRHKSYTFIKATAKGGKSAIFQWCHGHIFLWII